MWLRAGIVAGSAQGSISVTADNVCAGVQGKLHINYTKEVLEYRIDVNYLTYSLFELNGEVSVSLCGGHGNSRRRRTTGANDVVVSVTIRGDYESVLISLTVFSRRCDERQLLDVNKSQRSHFQTMHCGYGEEHVVLSNEEVLRID